MSHDNPLTEKDPWDWSLVIAVFFLALAWYRLGTPLKLYFDEIHYIPAARKLIEFKMANSEHPMVGKEILIAAITLLGDKPLYWRIPSAIAGTIGLFAFGRILWFISGRRFATLAGQFLLATNIAWFVQSRIAMLDMFMACFIMVALWMVLAVPRNPGQARWRMALAGLFMALALGTKWNVLPLVVLPGLFLLISRVRDHGKRFLLAREGSSYAPGVSLIEAGFWLGIMPLCLYWATYFRLFFLIDAPVVPWWVIHHHTYMLGLQESVVKPHPYSTVWYQWVGNWRGIWYLYENVDGAQRGILMIGNPFTMLAGLIGLGWSLFAAIRWRRWDAQVLCVLYFAALGLWIIAPKPIQFYFHYLLPSAFLCGALALATDALWRREEAGRAGALTVLIMAAVLFGYFYPIISAGPLYYGKDSFTEWMWLDSWR